jgi:hypothetical protein
VRREKFGMLEFRVQPKECIPTIQTLKETVRLFDQQTLGANKWGKEMNMESRSFLLTGRSQGDYAEPVRLDILKVRLAVLRVWVRIL